LHTRRGMKIRLALFCLSLPLAACQTSPDFSAFDTLEDDICGSLTGWGFDELLGEKNVADDGRARMAGPFLAAEPRHFAAGAVELLRVELVGVDPDSTLVARSDAFAITAQRVLCAGDGHTYHDLEVHARSAGPGKIDVDGNIPAQLAVDVREAHQLIVDGGERRVAAGAILPVSATLHDAGGATLYAHLSTTWTSSAPEVASVGEPGGAVTFIRGNLPGTAIITSRFGELSASFEIVVE
jgi:hypothetical protein